MLLIDDKLRRLGNASAHLIWNVQTLRQPFVWRPTGTIMFEIEVLFVFIGHLGANIVEWLM